MRDAIAAERRGLPTVLVLNGALENIVEETARVVCMPDVPVVAVEEPLFGRDRDEIAEIGFARGGDVERALVGT